VQPDASNIWQQYDKALIILWVHHPNELRKFKHLKQKTQILLPENAFFVKKISKYV